MKVPLRLLVVVSACFASAGSGRSPMDAAGDAPAFADTGAGAPSPSPLRVSDSGRMLIDASGEPVFLLADTAWSLALRLSREDAEAYLRTRRRQRFNAVTFVLNAVGQNALTDRPENHYGDLPFRLVDGKFDPSVPIVTPGSDPSDPEEYDFWDNVDHLVELTRRLGLYAIVLPSWGSAVAGSHSGTRPEEIIFDEENGHRYARWLAARYRDQPHIVWMLGGDRSAVYGERDFRPVIRAMAAGIAETAPGMLISYHPRKMAPQSSAWFHHDWWLSFNSVQEWPEDLLRNITRDWAMRPPKPTWVFEGRYEGYWRQDRPDDWGGWQMRQQAYQTVLAGGFGFTYGHERVFSFGLDGVDWKQYLDTPGARSMTHLAALMSSFRPSDLRSRRPAQELIEGDHGTVERLTSDWIGAAQLANGRKAIIYAANGRPIRVKLGEFSASPLFAWWFNPRNGRWRGPGGESSAPRWFEDSIPAGTGTKVREFVPPTHGDGQDWILILSDEQSVGEGA